MAEISQKPINEQFYDNQLVWNENIKQLTTKLKNIADIPELQNLVYYSRQDAVDYYYALSAQYAAFVREYKIAYATTYNSLKSGSNGLRYTTEASINAQIESILNEKKYVLDLYENHIAYMKDTIKSLDNIIYGINNRIELEKLIQGVKF